MRVTRYTKRKAPTTRRKKDMSEVDISSTEVVLSKRDMKNSGVLDITGENGSTGKLVVFFRHPVLADIIEKMAMGNYPTADFAPAYLPCLMAHPDPKAKDRSVSRPAIYLATKNFEAAADFSFSSAPRGVLVANPEKLRQGYSLVVELKTPVPHDTLRKWGKQLMDGCADIIAASRPFKMSWVMTETTPGKQ